MSTITTSAAAVSIWASVVGYSFNPYNGGLGYAPGVGAGVLSQTSGPASYFNCNIPIPSGALITDCFFQILKNDVNPAYLYLQWYDELGGVGTLASDTTFSGTSPNIQFVHLPISPYFRVPAYDAIVGFWRPGTVSTTHGIAGINVAYLQPGSFNLLGSPLRIVDTRDGTGGVTGQLLPNSTTNFGPFASAPIEARGLIVNMTAIGASGGGFMTIFGAGTTPPSVSNLNFSNDQYALSDLAVTGLGSGAAAGKFSIYVSNNVPVHVAVDIVGFVT